MTSNKPNKLSEAIVIFLASVLTIVSVVTGLLYWGDPEMEDPNLHIWEEDEE